jgi:hypothetical protein
MGDGSSLPAFQVIARALRVTTEVLAREVVNPSEVEPAWNEFEWGVARAVSAMHGLGALLANRSRWRGPGCWATFLREQRDHGFAHYQRAGVILRQIDAAARSAGIPCIALKGSALRTLNLHRAGERPMGDIDLLVAPHDVAAWTEVLASIGYESAYSMRRHDVFAPVAREEPHAFAEHARNPLRIELHTRIAECLPATAIDITQQLWPSELLPGINGYASRVQLLRHILLHTAGNMRAHALRFIQLYDIAELGRRLQKDEWLQLLETRDSRGRPWWIFPPLALAERYLPGSIPSEILASFRALSPYRLRLHARKHDLYGVSWSNLRISALPGSEWARTPLELMRFAKSRLIPSRAALRELAEATRAQPSCKQLHWYGASHGERILRWVFSRPPRVQTMVSVRAALDATQPNY